MASGNRTDISLDDPNFWQKWAKIAELDTEAKNEKVQHNNILFHGTFTYVIHDSKFLHSSSHYLLLSLGS